jgi:hypothetical protein
LLNLLIFFGGNFGRGAAGALPTAYRSFSAVRFPRPTPIKHDEALPRMNGGRRGVRPTVEATTSRIGRTLGPNEKRLFQAPVQKWLDRRANAAFLGIRREDRIEPFHHLDLLAALR